MFAPSKQEFYFSRIRELQSSIWCLFLKIKNKFAPSEQEFYFSRIRELQSSI